jgi:hypothetical protein
MVVDDPQAVLAARLQQTFAQAPWQARGMAPGVS